MWLSDRDLFSGVLCAISAKDVSFAVVNLVSNNPGMRWDLKGLRDVLNFEPADGATPAVDEQNRVQEESARKGHQLIEAIEAYGNDLRW